MPVSQGVRTFRNSPSLSFMMLALWMAVTLRRLFRYANPNAYSTVRRDFSCVITCEARACQHKDSGIKGLPLVLGKRSTLHEAWKACEDEAQMCEDDSLKRQSSPPERGLLPHGLHLTGHHTARHSRHCA